MDDEVYRLYTDGSCLGNPGPGGVGVLLSFPLGFNVDDFEYHRGYHTTTNNRMELRACIDGLRLARQKMKAYGYKSLEWYTDSQYVVDHLFYVEDWRKGSWIRANGEPVLNPDLWRELYNLAITMRVSPIWIERESNRKADVLAKRGAKNPTHSDFGYNPGRVGRPLGERGQSPELLSKDEDLHVRIYKGDGLVSKNDERCKIRFELIGTGGAPIGRYFAYVSKDIYPNLHRNHEYLLSFSNGNIVDILKEF